MSFGYGSSFGGGQRPYHGNAAMSNVGAAQWADGDGHSVNIQRPNTITRPHPREPLLYQNPTSSDALERTGLFSVDKFTSINDNIAYGTAHGTIDLSASLSERGKAEIRALKMPCWNDGVVERIIIREIQLHSGGPNSRRIAVDLSIWPSSGQQYVSASDMLLGIHESARKPVDIRACGRRPEEVVRFVAGFNERIDRLRAESAYDVDHETCRGIRAIDGWGAFRWFYGFSVVNARDAGTKNVWRLHLSATPMGPVMN